MKSRTYIHSFIIVLILLVTIPGFSQNNPVSVDDTALNTGNALPVVQNDTISIMVGETLDINIYDHAYDPEGDDFILDKVYDPRNGEADELSDSTFWVSIEVNYSGLDSLIIRLEEVESGSMSSGYLFLNVSSNPEFPFAVNDTIDAFQGDTVSFNILENDYDLQGDALSIEDIHRYSGMEFFDSNDSMVFLAPKATANPGLHNYFYYFNYEDGNHNHISNKAKGYVNVIENPNLPQAINDTIIALAGYPIEIPVLLNDYDINGDSLVIENVWSYEGLGFCEFSDSIITFTPYCYLTGDLELRYRIVEKHNSAHYSEFALIIVQLIENENQPLAVDDEINLNAFDQIEFNILENDTDPDNEPIHINYNGHHTGILDLSSDSLITILSTMNFSGTIKIPYTFCEVDNPAMVSNEALIHITILPDLTKFYGVNDTIATKPCLSGTKELISNDYNPGTDTLFINSIQKSEVIKNSIESDSIIKYLVQFSACYPEEFAYKIESKNDTLTSFGMVYFDIPGNCSRIDSLDVNNICATFSTVGLNFFDPYNFEDRIGKFEVPKGSGNETVFSNALWIGGTSNDSLFLAADRYHSYGEDYWTGPISEIYQYDDIAKYHVWKITSSDIDYHITHYQEPGYEPIEDILTWPGNGNTSLGQSFHLAPFFDKNNDEIYNPFDGDIPMIRGDQSLYFIYNDGRQPHTESDGLKMQVEIHGNAYAFDSPGDSSLFNTIFVHYDFYNRSDRTYDSTYVGIFNDFDLGYPWDDFIACDVTRGSAIIYNGKSIDGSGEEGSYGENPPIQSMVILGGAFMPEDGEDNPTGGCDASINGLNFGDGIIDNERMGMTRFTYYSNGGGAVCTPRYAPEYYNYLKGLWKDNTEVLYGGYGFHQYSVGPACRFMYPGASDPLNWGTNCEYPNGGYNQNGFYWTEETTQNHPDDRRGVSITGPFSFSPGIVQSLDIAYVYTRDFDTTDNISVFDIMNDRIDTLWQRVDRCEIINLPDNYFGISEINKDNLKITVYPNPSKGDEIHIDIGNYSREQFGTYQLKDLLGKSIKNGNLIYGKVNTIRIKGLKTGIYLLTVNFGDQMAIQKVMILK